MGRRGPRAAPGRIAERLADERSAARSNSLDRVLVRQLARLQQFVKFVRELVGDRGLELSEAIEVDLKGFLRHRLADQVVDGSPPRSGSGHRVRAPRPRPPIPADLSPASEVDPGHGNPFFDCFIFHIDILRHHDY
jgi:hypothetical protein